MDLETLESVMGSVVSAVHRFGVQDGARFFAVPPGTTEYRFPRTGYEFFDVKLHTIFGVDGKRMRFGYCRELKVVLFSMEDWDDCRESSVSD